MVWTVIFLVPVLNAEMMSEIHINMDNILVAWRKILPYFTIFIIHNSIVAPRFMFKRKYGLYILLNIIGIISVFLMVEFYERSIFDVVDIRQVSPSKKMSFSDLEIYWNILLGIFMTGANTGIKLIYQSIRDEQIMDSLKRQNLIVEMEYLKYQINPHFFMNTLNNIHSLIDIDADCAKNAIIDLSKMMRYVLYDSGSEGISLQKDIYFLNNYIELMRIRYANDIDIQMRDRKSVV